MVTVEVAGVVALDFCGMRVGLFGGIGGGVPRGEGGFFAI